MVRGPKGRYQYRYWAGDWTHFVANGYTVYIDSLPSVWRTALGFALTLQFGLLLGSMPYILFWFIGADFYPESRSGVTRNSDGVIQIVSAACTGERLQTVELHEVVKRGEEVEVVELWRIAGDAPMPPRLSLGGPVPGMRTTTALIADELAGRRLELRVTTTLLGHPYWHRFTPRHVGDEVLFYDDRVSGYQEFKELAYAETPCTRPDPPFKTLGILVLGSFFLALVGRALQKWPQYGEPAEPIPR